MEIHTRVGLYASLIALELALVLLIRRLARKQGTSLSTVIGGRWASATDVARDIAIAAGMWLAWTGFSRLVTTLMPARTGSAVMAMLPHGLLESALWIVLSISAGFAEELAFRGYLQRKFTSATTGVLVQAIIFALVHGYQGAPSVMRIFVYGAFFGVVAHLRGSVRPGMIAHAWTDVAAGLLRI